MSMDSRNNMENIDFAALAEKRAQEEADRRLKNTLQKEALRISCYVGGAGAFGVFLRWLQTQAAFTEDGLNKPSIWNAAIILITLAAAWVFLRFADKLRSQRYYLSGHYYRAFRSDAQIISVLRWVFGFIIFVGGILLFIKSDVDVDKRFYRVLAVLCVLYGASYPLLLSWADRDVNEVVKCVVSTIPVLTFAVWLVTCYKHNDINSVLWAYAVEIVASSVLMISFFRLAGWHFNSPSPWKSMFWSMLGAYMCIVSLADERYTGMQLVLLGTAGLLMLCNWVMICNLKPRRHQEEEKQDDGFEHLN